LVKFIGMILWLLWQKRREIGKKTDDSRQKTGEQGKRIFEIERKIPYSYRRIQMCFFFLHSFHAD